MCPLKEKEQNWMWHSYSSFIYNQITPDVAGCGCVPYARLQVFYLFCFNAHQTFILHPSDHKKCSSWILDATEKKNGVKLESKTKFWPWAALQRSKKKANVRTTTVLRHPKIWVILSVDKLVLTGHSQSYSCNGFRPSGRQVNWWMRWLFPSFLRSRTVPSS